MAGNTNLHSAKKAKNDEFYTRKIDIEAELWHYAWQFKDKVVYCNCDDPVKSEFWKFFARVFDLWDLKKLIATYYEPNGDSFVYKIEAAPDGSGEVKQVMEPLSGNSDFRSDGCVELLKEADIVVTNPPFSLFREYVSQLMEYGKKFLIIGNMNAVTYKEIFPLIRDNRLWLGQRGLNKDMYFDVPDERKEWLVSNKKEGSAYKIIDGVVMGRLASACWFTNLDHEKRHESLNLRGNTYNGHENLYPRYDNYDAINVGSVEGTRTKPGIPGDYDGVMGVPVTFLGKYCPEQFEIVVFRKDNGGKDLVFTREREKEFNRTFEFLFNDVVGPDYRCEADDLRQRKESLCQDSDTTEDMRFFAEYICSHPDLIKLALAERGTEPVEIFFKFDTDGVHKMLLDGKEPFKRILIRRR